MPQQTNKPGRPGTSCVRCSWRRQCLPLQADSISAAYLDGIVVRGRVRAGRQLFRAGGKPAFLYIIRTGSLRTEIHDRDGMRHITGFYFPAETIGSDGLSSSRYRSDAVALEDSAYCAIPFAAIPELLSARPRSGWQLVRLVSEELARGREHRVMLGKSAAVQRIAMFVEDLLDRQGRRQGSPDTLSFSMSRSDIANHVSLAVETVSRTLSKMQEQGVLAVKARSIRVLDARKLSEMAALTAASA